jgi:hypothetical protein
MAFIRDDLEKVKAFLLMVVSTDNNFDKYNSFINSFKLAD